MLLDNLRKTQIEAMKAHDAVTVETVRYLLAAIQNVAIAKYGAAGETKLTDADVLDVVKKQVKTHNESIEAFSKAGRIELAEGEKAQLRVLEQYLPEQVSDEELKAILEPIVESGGKLSAERQDLGPLMGKAMKAVAGKADGNRVLLMLKQLASSQYP